MNHDYDYDYDNDNDHDNDDDNDNDNDNDDNDNDSDILAPAAPVKSVSDEGLPSGWTLQVRLFSVFINQNDKRHLCILHLI